jgi:hypothetical protein
MRRRRRAPFGTPDGDLTTSARGGWTTTWTTTPAVGGLAPSSPISIVAGQTLCGRLPSSHQTSFISLSGRRPRATGRLLLVQRLRPGIEA